MTTKILTMRFWLAVVAALCVCTPMAIAADRPYSMLYVFGDSYSDTGAGYIDGNGPTAVAYLAQRLAIPFTYRGDPHSKRKGLNFAVSAAQTGTGKAKRYPHGEVLGLGMREQVDDFASLAKRRKIKFNPKQTMFFFAGGLNDRSSSSFFSRRRLIARPHGGHTKLRIGTQTNMSTRIAAVTVNAIFASDIPLPPRITNKPRLGGMVCREANSFQSIER
jgi:hypothetical protein